MPRFYDPDHPPDTECIYHGFRWRSRYQKLLNELRETLIKKEDCFRLGKIICSCAIDSYGYRFGEHLAINMRPDDDPRWADIHENAIVAAEKFLETYADENSPFPATISSIKQFIADLRNDSAEPTQLHDATGSSRRLLYVLQQIINGDFSLLQPLPNEAPTPAGVPAVPVESTHTYTMGTISGQYLGNLIGKEGQHIKTIIRRYNCKISMSKNDTGNIDVKLTTKKKDPQKTFEVVKEALLKYAREKVAYRMRHEQWVKQYAQMKASGALPRGARTKASPGNQSVKQANTETFETKHKGHLDETSKRQQASKPPGVLEQGSRCLNCLAPYDKTADSANDCRHHPGYICEKTEGKVKRHVWSCCDKEAENEHPSQEEHQETGCQTSVHNWRPHKSAANSKKGVSVQEESLESQAADLGPSHRICSARGADAQTGPSHTQTRSTLADFMPDLNLGGDDLEDDGDRDDPVSVAEGGPSQPSAPPSSQEVLQAVEALPVEGLPRVTQSAGSMLSGVQEQAGSRPRTKPDVINEDCLLHGRKLRSHFQMLANQLLQSTLLPKCEFKHYCKSACCCVPSTDQREAGSVEVDKLKRFLPRKFPEKIQLIQPIVQQLEKSPELYKTFVLNTTQHVKDDPAYLP